MRTSWVVAVAVLLAACRSGPPTDGAASSTALPSVAESPAPSARVTPPGAAGSPGSAPVSPAGSAAAVCPATYAPPDPKRPRLSASVSFSGGTVTGSERIVFTPDLAVSEIVLRLWAAAPRPAGAGGGIDIQSTSIDGRTMPSRRSAATVLQIPAGVAAGQAVTIAVTFTLHLPTGINDRFGHRGTTAWFGSGLPLLAWERGRGWALEPATSAFAEASTSEEMQLTSLSVRRVRGLAVLGPGRQLSDDGTTAVFAAPTVRDVAVAVGAFRRGRDAAAGQSVLDIGVAPGLADDTNATVIAVERAMGAHAERFGPFPYEHLAVAVLPDIRGGIEYPGVILLGTGQTKGPTASHEVAHQWFYGLVGDDQARDPWLDEAFATYAEALDHGTAASYEQVAVPVAGRGRVGQPMTFWETRQSIYFRSVYVQGAVALLEARRASGAAAFDDALRCYVRRNAHRIATPNDVRTALATLPAALRILTAAGALS